MKKHFSLLAALMFGAGIGVMDVAPSTPAAATEATSSSTSVDSGATQTAPTRADNPQAITPWKRAPSNGTRKPGPGWTNRQVQRMARKKRNQARNRAAHRG